VAPILWRAFGPTVPNYVEPFAGSLTVLLGRPGGPGHYETINDRDCYLSNFWRAIRADAETVAGHADWPVNEADLHARHAWLAAQVEFRSRMLADPEYFDPRIAGWWVWGVSQWIGDGWCSETGPGQRRMPAVAGAKGPHGTRLPGIGNSRGTHGLSKPPCSEWFAALAARLRCVRPLYALDDFHISWGVHEWCLEHGVDRRLRIALCGYEGEHAMPRSWRVHAWKAHGGYGVRNPENQSKRRERIWLSPHCLPFEQQRELFGEWMR
jgi:DNA adenine methylase